MWQGLYHLRLTLVAVCAFLQGIHPHEERMSDLSSALGQQATRIQTHRNTTGPVQCVVPISGPRAMSALSRLHPKLKK